jgi:hypothetical protein
MHFCRFTAQFYGDRMHIESSLTGIHMVVYRISCAIPCSFENRLSDKNSVFLYLVGLLAATLSHQRAFPDIWYYRMQHFPPLPRPKAIETPKLPSLPRIIRPIPRRAAPPPTSQDDQSNARPSRPLMTVQRSGLQSSYEIEYYSPPSHVSSRDMRPRTPPPAAARPKVPPVDRNFTDSFYPSATQAHMGGRASPGIRTRPEALPTSMPSSNTAESPLPTVTPPPPLGDWPHSDAMSRPTQPKKNHTSTMADPVDHLDGERYRSHPFGPRGPRDTLTPNRRRSSDLDHAVIDGQRNAS